MKSGPRACDKIDKVWFSSQFRRSYLILSTIASHIIIGLGREEGGEKVVPFP
jgi:hypothetical protein